MATDAGLPPPAAPGVAVALISAAVLAYEILLMALFSLIQWHHFAFLVVSIALLGFGLSGSFLALARERLADRDFAFMASQAAAFAIAAPAAYALAQRLSFNPEELIWDGGHWLRLGLVILLLMLPFFFAANLIGFALDRYRRRQATIYAADLAGAGAGALALIALLAVLPPAALLRAIALLGCAAGLALWLGRRERSGRWLAALLALAALIALYPARWSAPLISPYKEMSQLLRVSGARVLAERHGPLGRVSVVDSGAIPWRHAPGLSLVARTEPPPQLALFTNAGAPSAILAYSGERDALAYLDQLTSALPYHVGARERVLVLGAGGGAGVWQALYHGAASVDAVELNPQIVDLVAREFAEFSGGLYSHSRVSVRIADARGFLERDGARYDLIQVPPLDAAGGAGVQGLHENFVYTIEALARALERLAPAGVVALTRWISLPPRDSLKLFAAAQAALARAGIEAPARHLALIRGLQTSTLLISRAELDAAAIGRLRGFADARLFDLVYYPGMPRALANRYNRLDTPAFYDGVQALLGPGRDDFLRDYKFDLRPASDDRPYHFHFARPGTLLELLRLRDSGGGGLLETGYLTILVALVLAVAIGLGLILAPLLALRRRARGETAYGAPRTMLYFGAIGLGFLLLEIAFLQKYVLLLHHPIYAAATVLASFLLGAGIGSAHAQRHAGKCRARRVLQVAVGGILLLGSAHLLLLDTVIAASAAISPGPRLLVGVALIAPLAFCLGLPFPLGLAALGDGAPALVPWAWGINGCASVAGAILATLLAIHFGFAAVIAIALGCYALAAATFPRPRDGRKRRPVVKTAAG